MPADTTQAPPACPAPPSGQLATPGQESTIEFRRTSGPSPASTFPRMKVALTVNDFLRRAELVYPDRVAIVDEPDQPAESWGEITIGAVH